MSQDRSLSNAKVNCTLMKESANWGLGLGKGGAKNLFLCRVFRRIFSWQHCYKLGVRFSGQITKVDVAHDSGGSVR